MVSDSFSGLVQAGIVASVFVFIINSVFLWFVAKFKLSDKSWGTAFKVSGITGIIGLIFGIILNDFPAPLSLLTHALLGQIISPLSIILNLVTVFAFIFLVRKFYKISWQRAAFFGLLIIIVSTILAHFFMLLFFAWLTLFVWSGGFSF
jgi:hypothetical protein